MLQKIERDPPAFIQGDDLAIYEGAEWKTFTRADDIRELTCEKVSSPRPERHPGRIPASKTTVTVKLDS
jgi:hypothetical protein